MENHLGIKNLGKQLQRAISKKESACPRIYYPTGDMTIAHLSGTPESRLHAVLLRPGEKDLPHYYTYSADIYVVLKGTGAIYSRYLWKESVIPPDGECDIGFPETNEPVIVQTGDSFSIPPGLVFQLHNCGEEDLLLLLACPDTNLSGDRLFPNQPLSTVF